MSQGPSFQVAEPLQAFVHRQVESGRYASPAEVIDAGLRLLEENETELDALREALDAGEASGVAATFSRDEFFARMHTDYPLR